MNSAFSIGSLGLLLDLTLKMTLVLLLAFAATALLRRSSASARRLTWHLAFGGVLAIPFLALLLPDWKSSWLPSVLLGRGASVGGETIGAACAALVDPSLSSLLAFLGHPLLGGFSMANIFFITWATGVVLLLMKAILERLALAVAFARSNTVDHAEIVALLQSCVAKVGLTKTPQLAIGFFGTPATFGLLTPKIIIPIESANWPLERWRVVLLHELAHIKGKDYPFNLAAQLVCAILWHNPLVWLAASRMRLERECAADDHVLDSGEHHVEYAQHLFDIAQTTHTRGLSVVAAVAMAHHCPLKTRVAQILNPGTRRERLSKKTALAVSLLFFGLLAPLAAMQPQASLGVGMAGQLPLAGAQVISAGTQADCEPLSPQANTASGLADRQPAECNTPVKKKEKCTKAKRNNPPCSKRTSQVVDS